MKRKFPLVSASDVAWLDGWTERVPFPSASSLPYRVAVSVGNPIRAAAGTSGKVALTDIPSVLGSNVAALQGCSSAFDQVPSHHGRPDCGPATKMDRNSTRGVSPQCQFTLYRVITCLSYIKKKMYPELDKTSLSPTADGVWVPLRLFVHFDDPSTAQC